MFYTVSEDGPHWVVRATGSGYVRKEVARYHKADIAWNGYTDIDELRDEIARDLRLKATDRLEVD